MKREFEDHSDKPLYRWKLLENGTVIKTGPITEYLVEKMWSNKVRYTFLFPSKKTIGYCNESDLDTFSHSRIFSFNPDDKHALEIIRQFLEIRRDAMQTEYEYAQEMLNRFDGDSGCGVVSQ